MKIREKLASKLQVAKGIKGHIVSKPEDSLRDFAHKIELLLNNNSVFRRL